VRISKESLFGTRFLASSRPFIFPFVLKLFQNNAEAVAWTQGIFSILSWGILAVAVAYSLHIVFLRLIAFGLMLLLSLYRYVIAWDSVLLTESVSLSLMALLIANWLWLTRGWRWYKVILLSLIAFLWTFSRDTNAWVVLMVALFLFLLLGLRLIDKKYFILFAIFIAMFFLSNLSADLGDRWVFPFQNILGRRILPDPQAVDYFSNCGMPVTPELMELKGGFANSRDRAFYEDPTLEGYRIWLHREGKLCYVKWLLSDPLESIKGPLAEFNTLISLQEIQPSLFSRTFSPILPSRLEAILYPRPQLLILFAIVCVITLIALLSKAWMQNKVWWVVIALNILVFSHYFIVWHGDVMGIYRHVLTVSIQFYLGLWMLILFITDSLLSFKAAQEDLNKRLLRYTEPAKN
jgi:hypothetical protein